MKFSTRTAKRVKAVSAVLSLVVPIWLAAQETALRSQANAVLVPTLVKDSGGAIVYGLRATDFIVEDDGVPQALTLDETPEGQPISIVVAIQKGRRASYEFSRIRKLNSMLEPIINSGYAKVAVLEFDSEVHSLHDFTSNADRVTQDLTDLTPGDNGAAILDAIDSSIKLLKQVPRERQRVLLLISETRDHGSHAKIDDVVAAIGNSNSIMYALTFSPALSNILDTARGTNKDEMHNGIDFLDLMNRARQAMRKNIPSAVAAMTGGEYELFATRNKFEARMNDFTNHLQSRYLLSFAPVNPRPGLHQIRVALREPSAKTVLARSNYWAAEPRQ